MSASSSIRSLIDESSLITLTLDFALFGRWLGGGAARLDLTGDVRPDDLRAVLAGLAPGTGGLDPNGNQLRTSARRVPGFDLTFKLPKSASVLYAVSDDPRVQGAVIEAGEAAMRSAIGWLERCHRSEE